MEKLIFVFTCLLLVIPCQAKTIYVDANAQGANNGQNWENAFNFLQDALADANTSAKPVEIFVAEGVYKPDRCAGQILGDRNATFQLIKGVTIKGGYAGFDEPDPNKWDFELYETILSGDLDGNDVDVNDPCDLLYEPTRDENSYHVVTSSGTEPNAVLNGFTITGGKADGSYPDNCGGGLFNYTGKPTVTNCTFKYNTAKEGGGIFNYLGSRPILVNCTFSSNYAMQIGGGMYNGGSSPTLANCTFIGNSAGEDGGGMYNKGTVFAAPFIYGYDTEDPQEMSFDSSGYLYVGHSRNSCGLSIYRIPPGGGSAEEVGNGAFCDPDGLDVDSMDTVWVASGLWANVQDGEIIKYIPKTNELIKCGSNYLRNPTSLEIDRIGRFGELGSSLVSQQNSITGGGQILSVSASGANLVIYETTEYWNILDMCFDMKGSLWFIEGSGVGGEKPEKLYEWPQQGTPNEVTLTGVTGSLSGLAFDGHEETLVVGISTERKIVKVSLDGQLVQELSGDIDPRSITLDALGNIYVSDIETDVVWKISRVDGNPRLANCILWGNSPTEVYGGSPSITYSDVQGGWPGLGNIDVNPYFEDPNNGDYHLKSQAGRWDANSKSWVKDDVTSPCIDAGNPGCPLRNEPNDPNNVRINMGAYGGTDEASKSPSNWRSIADMTNDWIVDSNDLKVFVDYWLQTGECIPSDLNRSQFVDLNDFAIFGLQWSHPSASEPGITYQIEKCDPNSFRSLATNQAIETRFSVTVEGLYIHFKDMMVANCCTEKLGLEMTVEEELITIYEIEYIPGVCFCICDYPVTATLGPFEPGTYILEVYEDWGGLIGSTAITIGTDE